MRKEIFEQAKKELVMIAVLFVLAVLAFKAIFLPEDFLVVLRTVATIFWVLAVPGFAVMFYWREELKFHERLIIGIGVGTTLMGLLSYYTGLIGLHVKYHAILLPLFLILIGIVLSLRR